MKLPNTVLTFHKKEGGEKEEEKKQPNQLPNVFYIERPHIQFRYSVIMI